MLGTNGGLQRAGGWGSWPAGCLGTCSVYDAFLADAGTFGGPGQVIGTVGGRDQGAKGRASREPSDDPGSYCRCESPNRRDSFVDAASAEAGRKIVNMWPMFDWVGRWLGADRPSPRYDGQSELEKHQARAVRQSARYAVNRADRAVDDWNDRVVRGW